MKKNKLTMLCYFLCTVFCSCNSQTGDKDFIPGTYIREVKNEFSIGRDTLIIDAANQLKYIIFHKGSYRRIKDGKLLALKNIAETWVASYDEIKQVLVEAKKGKIISFDPSKGALFVGSSMYSKIK